MWQYMLASYSLLIIMNISFIEAAETYFYPQANRQGYPLPIDFTDPFQQRQVSMQQKHLLPRDGNIFGLQNHYPYQTLEAAASAESIRNQQNNYAFAQPTGTTYAQQSQLPLRHGQEQRQQQQQQQRLPYWLNSEPIVGDYASAPRIRNVYRNEAAESLRNNVYNQELTQPNRSKFMLYTPTPDYTEDSFYRQIPYRIDTPTSRDLILRNSLLPQQSNRYATHFERYLRKYPERLEPTYSNIATY